uniref:copper resistance CopC family protein n=1 Tax=Catenulispora pinisilvae TaxID=2705253 RepID=UPI001891863A
MSLTRRVLTVCAAAIAALVVLAGPASAHAELVASTPSQGAVVRSEPTQVALRFSEEIVLRLSAVKVIGPDGRRLDTGAPHTGPFGADSMAVDLAPEARHGTFVVVWQATAADDGHASSGQVQFSVGAPSAAVSVAGLGHNRLTSAMYDAGQWVGFAGLAMVGGVAALFTYRRRGRPRGDGSPIEHQARGTDINHAETTAVAAATAGAGAGAGATELDTGDSRAELQSEGTAAIATTPATEPEPQPQPQPATLTSASTSIPTWPAALGWSLLLIGTLIQVTAYAPAARGLPLTHLLDRSLLSVTLGTREGHAFMARLVVLAVAAVVGDAVLRRATGPGLPLAFTLAVAATWGATGHAATGGGAGVAMVALTLH